MPEGDASSAILALAPFDCATVPAADGFDYPVGAPDAIGYYNAQDFLVNTHLGEDWNGRGGGNTDFGDPVYAIANGQVREAKDVALGWGNVVRVAHRTEGGCIESLYAHLSDIAVDPGETVVRGQLIGHIGDAGGRYIAHLHLELRDVVSSPLGAGYGEPKDQVDPHGFIDAHRPKR